MLKFVYMEETLFSVRQVGILLKVHPLTVRRYIRDGKLKAIRIAGNIRVPQSYLDNFSEDVQPTKYGVQPTKKTKTMEFTLDDAIFRLKGRGLSIRAI